MRTFSDSKGYKTSIGTTSERSWTVTYDQFQWSVRLLSWDSDPSSGRRYHQNYTTEFHRPNSINTEICLRGKNISIRITQRTRNLEDKRGDNNLSREVTEVLIRHKGRSIGHLQQLDPPLPGISRGILRTHKPFISLLHGEGGIVCNNANKGEEFADSLER